MNPLRTCMLRIISKTSFSNPKNATTCIKLDVKFSSAAKNLLNNHSYSVKKLKELFDIRESRASSIIQDHKKFAVVSANEIDNTYKTCIDAGITKGNLLNYVEVLATFSVSDKIELLKQLRYDLNATLPLLVLDEKLLKKFVIQEINEKRIKYFEKIFNVILCLHCFAKSTIFSSFFRSTQLRYVNC